MPRDFWRDAAECVEAAITFLIAAALVVLCATFIISAVRFLASHGGQA